MSETLCTFSGRNGDILWSLATAREISRQKSEKVDFAIMPQYKSLIPLLEGQSYISQAYAIDEWKCTGSPCGDQPWEAPIAERKYKQVFHLTYRSHPGIGGPAMPLIDFIAWQQGLKLSEPVIPFIDSPGASVLPMPERSIIPYAFNAMVNEQKQAFVEECIRLTGGEMSWVSIAQEPWLCAADVIERAGIFVGDRSACWVLAMGLGVPTITYEPNVSRSAYGQFGKVFGCPYGRELALTGSNAAADAVAEISRVLNQGVIA